MSFKEYDNFSGENCHCANNNCSALLTKKDQQINFEGEINMTNSSISIAKKKYSNKAGGPRPVINGKVVKDAKPKW
jgi:hypothetical protein